ncbi:MAG: TonB-dependent receptor, partial [Bacteroidota bacterium]
DLKMGSNYPAKYPNFGRRSQYIASINGVDSIVKNSDDRIQKYSGYSQWDVSQKVLFQQNKKVTHLLNLQYSNSTNVPRYDRLQDLRNGSLRFAEWYYGPQTRTLAAYELSVQSTGIFNDIKAIVSHQFIKESRHQREYRRYDRLDNRIEKLNVVAYTIDARKLWQAHEVTIGTDGQLNKAQSTAFRKNTNTGSVSPLDTRYPNGSNNMNYFGLYAQHLFKFGNGQWVLNDGVRLQTTQLRSTIADNSFFNFPFVEISTNNVALTGNVGLIYMPSADLRFALGLSSGFRAPNIDDLSRIFESNSASRQIIIPNPGIKPEYTYNADLGFTKNFGAARIEAGTFYTLFRNAIALAPFQLNGEDSIPYNGSNAKVFANQNINKAQLYGFYGNLSIEFAKRFKFFGSINYTYGKLQPATSPKVPLDHIPPIYGRVSLNYTMQKFWAEGYVMYNGWKRTGSYNPSGEDNLQYATADGTPAWTTLNFKTGFSVTKNLQAQAGVENILDRNYRPFASGFSGGGRNFILSLRSTF